MKSTGCEVGGLAAHRSPGSTPGFLFLHGNSADHRTFEPLLADDTLAPWQRVAVDLPGHGASPLRGPVTLRGLVEAVAAAAEAARAAVVFGHSLGGHLALQALGLGLLPGVRGVVVLGTPPIPGGAGLGIAFRPTPSMGLIFQEKLDDDAIALWASEAFGPHIGPPPWFAEALRTTHPAVRPGLAASVAAEGLLDEVALLDAAPVPVAVLHAAEDAYCAPDHMAGLQGRALWRGGIQVIPHVGHYVPWEAPAAVAAHLAAFMNDVAPA